MKYGWAITVFVTTFLILPTTTSGQLPPAGYTLNWNIPLVDTVGNQVVITNSTVYCGTSSNQYPKVGITVPYPTNSIDITTVLQRPSTYYCAVTTSSTQYESQYSAELIVPYVPAPDTDGDGVPDYRDNCITIPNPDQRDTDHDGYGNRCDADLNNSGGVINISDLAVFKRAYGTSITDPKYNPDADFNGDGYINILDLGIFKKLYNKVPGPSGLVH